MGSEFISTIEVLKWNEEKKAYEWKNVKEEIGYNLWEKFGSLALRDLEREGDLDWHRPEHLSPETLKMVSLDEEFNVGDEPRTYLYRAWYGSDLKPLEKSLKKAAKKEREEWEKKNPEEVWYDEEDTKRMAAKHIKELRHRIELLSEDFNWKLNEIRIVWWLDF